MIDHDTKKVSMSQTLTIGMTEDDKIRLQEQYIRARPFLKKLAEVAEKEMAKSVKSEEQPKTIENMNAVILGIGRRAGLRYIVDLIKRQHSSALSLRY